MTVRGPIFGQAGSYSAEDVRLAMITAVHGAPTLSTSTIIRPSGVFPGFGGSLKVTQTGGTPSMKVRVASGAAMVAGAATTQGDYILVNDGNVDVTVTASDPTYARVDIVVARVRDAQYVDIETSDAFEVIAGTPAASPVTPGVPSESMLLATVAVAAAATSISTSNITDNRKWAVAVGGTQPVAVGERPANPFDGMSVYEVGAGKTFRWNASSSAWKRVPSEDEVGIGRVAFGSTAGGATNSGSAFVNTGATTANFAFKAGRRYLIKAWGNFAVPTGVHNINFIVTDGSNAAIPDVVGGWQAAVTGTSYVSLFGYFEPSDDVTMLVKSRFQQDALVTTTVGAQYVEVRDVGSAS